MSARGECPGPRRCFARSGCLPCCVHGCRVCGAFILADTELWPAPLCIAHAPEPLIDMALELRHELARLLSCFDGVHSSDCVIWRELRPGVSDFELGARMQAGGGGSLCSCGYFSIREAARLRFNIGEALRSDTERSPAPASDRAVLS